MASDLNIIFAVSELAGIVKTGGLADAAGGLAPAMIQQGHDVRIIMPGYREALKKLHSRVIASGEVTINYHYKIGFALRKAYFEGIAIYLIEHHDFFGRDGLYGMHGEGYDDNSQRFAFFSKAVLEACLLIDVRPDVIHCHDWQTALLPYYLRIHEGNNLFFQNTATVLTIHNAAYQQHTDPAQMDALGIAWRYFNDACFEDHQKINLLKGGIAFADKITTVSPNYAEELLTELGGHGLTDSFRRRHSDLSGILNGCDYRHWDPSIDELIPELYSKDALQGKHVCKRLLQERMHLTVDNRCPVYGVVSRLTDQKGFSFLLPALQKFLHKNIQVVVLGSGDQKIATELQWLSQRYPEKCRFINGFDNELAHWIEAGSDFFLMPSLFEPCGLNQMYSLKYGALPIVRAVGGLLDTVEGYDEAGENGTGFIFELPDAHDLVSCLYKTLTIYEQPKIYKKMQQNAMSQRFTWNAAADAYCDIYRSIH
ncbi:MAG: glycogen synthase GlgA [Endozoicomonas sp. (ex Botrylloides leachii)]|nr:glycogen synthase GlgA [Endozoicomonas sp. (ex Botrylloides leachii)]